MPINAVLSLAWFVGLVRWPGYLLPTGNRRRQETVENIFECKLLIRFFDSSRILILGWLSVLCTSLRNIGDCET